MAFIPRLMRSVAVLATLVATLLPAAAAAAPPGGGHLLLTLAARSCPTYADITANLARNNIMESLRDLGPNTPYNWGEAVDPAVEERVQPKCVPLPDWTFTLGDGYRTKAVTGPWGALSIVRNPFEAQPVTRGRVDLLDGQGMPTGKTIAGAVTIALNSRQAELAAKRSLWVQGGTVSDPVLATPFPGPRYGFGALRCAVDNVNGDNVEYVAYPASVTHVFCFAYYVEPPPTSGTIVIRKEVQGPAGTDETFGFAGNISYNPGGRFDLAVRNGKPAEEKFFRGASGDAHPWTVRELGVPDWRLADLHCDSRDGTSETRTSTDSGEATIRLGAGDLVTCTYVDAYDPPPQGLEIRKVTLGGTGSFGFDVEPIGGGDRRQATATTSEEGLAAAAEPSPLDLAPGRYELQERAPESERGEWRRKDVECNGQRQPAGEPVVVEVEARHVSVCEFTNEFVPRGSIEISKVTRGAVGTAGFLIEQPHGPRRIEQSATTEREGVPARAHGDDSSDLELGHYSILDLSPPPHGGRWSLTYVTCDGRAVPFSEGRIEISLTPEHPHRHCTFTNSFDPTPPQPPMQPEPPGPDPNLVVTKQALSNTARAGSVVTYRLTVANEGGGVAEQVELIDQPLSPAGLVGATPSQGSCGNEVPLICKLGSIGPGQSATVEVRLRLYELGQVVNRAIAGTSSEESDVAQAQADADVRVRPRHPLAAGGS